MTDIVDTITSRRLALVVGKGGVGKTTMAAALGQDAARRGRRVCIYENSHSEALAPLFAKKPIGHCETEVEPGLWICNLDPRRCFENYVVRTLRSKTLYKLLFRNRLVSVFIEAMPGLDEILMFGEMLAGLEPPRRGKTPRFDLVIFDAPATGHGVTFLNTPHALMEMLKTGPVFKLAERVFERLSDPSFSSIVTVTLGEEMPITETVEMIRGIEEKHALPWSPVLVNMVTEAALDEGKLALLEQRLDGEPEAARMLPLLGSLVSQARTNQEAIERLRQRLDREVVTIPRIAGLGTRDQAPEGLGELMCHLRSSSR